jgi:hypothetical protein
MAIFAQLQKNRGTTSSALGKALAAEVLKGDGEILKEAVGLTGYDLRNEKCKDLRAGAAKIVEIVAEKRPELVAPHLEEIFPALEAKEPQTRWMLMMTFGYCAKLNPETAGRGIPYAKKFIEERQGVCLSGAAERYLGRIGALSPENAEAVLPVLLGAYDDPIPNEIDWIFEAFAAIFGRLSSKSREAVLACAGERLEVSKPATKKRAERILKLGGKMIKEQ